MTACTETDDFSKQGYSKKSSKNELKIEGLYYRVQIAAHKNPVDNFEEQFLLENVEEIRSKDGLFRYLTGHFDNILEARKLNTSILEADNNIDQAHIVAFYKGAIFPLDFVLNELVNYTEQEAIDVFEDNLAKELDVRFNTLYTIQMGAFSEEKKDKFKEVPNVIEMKKDDIYKYYSGVYSSVSDARKGLDNIKQLGFEKAYIVAYDIYDNNDIENDNFVYEIEKFLNTNNTSIEEFFKYANSTQKEISDIKGEHVSVLDMITKDKQATKKNKRRKKNSKNTKKAKKKTGAIASSDKKENQKKDRTEKESTKQRVQVIGKFSKGSTGEPNPEKRTSVQEIDLSTIALEDVRYKIIFGRQDNDDVPQSLLLRIANSPKLEIRRFNGSTYHYIGEFKTEREALEYQNYLFKNHLYTDRISILAYLPDGRYVSLEAIKRLIKKE